MADDKYYKTVKSSETAPGRFDWNFSKRIFKLILVIGHWGISEEIAHRQMSGDLIHDKSKLGELMTWWRQATSHYLTQIYVGIWHH